MTFGDDLKRIVKRRLVVSRLERNRRQLAGRSKMANGRLSERYWDCETRDEGVLAIGGVSVRELVRKHGTPLHVVHLDRLRADHDHFLAAFRAHYQNTILGTSYKTNPVPGVLRELHRFGTLAEVISEFELWLALKLGMP